MAWSEGYCSICGKKPANNLVPGPEGAQPNPEADRSAQAQVDLELTDPRDVNDGVAVEVPHGEHLDPADIS